MNYPSVNQLALFNCSVRSSMKMWAKFVSALAVAVFVVAATADAARKLSGGDSTCNPAAICTLSRVPWEGGPAYWAQFSPMVAGCGGGVTFNCWTNPAFFPIGIWLAGQTTDQPALDVYKAVGMNGFPEVKNTNNIALMNTNGMWAMPTYIFDGAPLPSPMGTETVGYLLEDEPELSYGVGTGGFTGASTPRDTTQCIPPSTSQCAQAVLLNYKSRMPDTLHPYYANFSFKILLYADVMALANGYTNIISHDIYWYGAGSCGQFLGAIVPGSDIDVAHCQRSSNYGNALAQLRALTSPLQPVFGFVESGLTAQQYGGAIWNNLINEARGVLVFNISCCGCFDYIKSNCGAGANAGLTVVTGQVTALAPVLNTQSFVWNFNSNINSMLKFGPDGKWYIFAMQAGFNNSGTYTFTLPAGFTTASTATVLNESRTVPISAGTFSDTFAAEYTYHIYQITP